MSDRRSGRSRKTVDYSKFAAGDSDNDDDFREMSTQPTKRKKTEGSSPKSVKVKLTKLDVVSCEKEIKKLDKQLKDNENDAKRTRPCLSDKVFQRHLSEVLEISKQNSQPLPSKNGNESSLLLNGKEENEEEEEGTEGDKVKADLCVSSDGNIVTNGDPSCKESTKGKRLKAEDTEWNDASSSESDEEDDASDWSDDDKEMEVKKSAVKNNKISKVNQDEENECDWSDGDAKKKSKKPAAKKSESKKQSVKPASTKVSHSHTPVSLKCSNPSKRTPASSSISPGLKSNMKTPGTPCQVISSPVKLPPKGLRLGLSRKVPSKPLHSVIRVPH